MVTQHKPVIRSEIMSGWKDIANYLGKGVRTVQRYERTLAMPVRRPAGTPCGSVVAICVELDHWVLASPMRSRAKKRLNSRTAGNLKVGVFKLRRLCAEGHELMKTITS